MSFMEQAAAKLARKFGAVSEGKHKGCQIALGNDPSQKVELTDGFSQVIFVDGAEEKGRYNIAGDFLRMEILDHDERGLRIMLVFQNEEACKFVLETKEERNDGVVGTLLKTLLGQKTAQNTTLEEKKQEKFRNIKIFMRSTMSLLPVASLSQLLSYYNTNEIMEKVDLELFKQCADVL